MGAARTPSKPAAPMRKPPGAHRPPRRSRTSPSSGVLLTTYTPTAVQARTWESLLAYCHLSSASEAVNEDRHRRMGGAARQSQGSASQTIAQGTTITVVPEIAGCEFNPPSANFLWFEDFHLAEFRFRTREKSRKKSFSGRVCFYVGPLLIGETAVAFRVEQEAGSRPGKEEPPVEASSASIYQSIFVSYSHQDTMIVEQLERAYEALGMQYLRDVRILRSGEEWNPALLQKIDEADIFQLCWSKNAKRSRYVKEEWKHALKKRKRSFIRPVYWDLPMPTPPAELAKLHFAYYAAGSR